MAAAMLESQPVPRQEIPHRYIEVEKLWLHIARRGHAVVIDIDDRDAPHVEEGFGDAGNVGYSTSADLANEFGLTNDLSLVTVVATPQGTMFAWEQYYDHVDLPAMRADFDQGIADIGQRLVARFGGRIVERYVDGLR